MCARIANFIPTFFHCPACGEGVGPVMRAQSPSFGVASNGPVNILTAVLFAGAERADEHFGSLNDS